MKAAEIKFFSFLFLFFNFVEGHCACVIGVPSGLKSGCHIPLAGVVQVVVSWSMRVLVLELGTAVRTAGAFNY